MLSQKVSKLGVSVYLAKNAITKDGKAPVVAKVGLDGNRVVIRIGVSVFPETWSIENSRAIGKDVSARQCNREIEDFLSKLEATYFRLTEQFDNVNVQMLRDSMNGLEPEREVKMILCIWDAEIERMMSLVGKEYAITTVRKYRTHRRIMSEFLKSKFGTADIHIERINPAFIEKFKIHLLMDHDFGKNTTAKILRNLKKMLFICIRKGWLSKDPFAEITLGYEDVDRPYLDEIELKRLVGLKLDSYSLQKSKDMFLFSCFTGLAYIDLRNLQRQDFEISNDQIWIKTRRQKTNTRSNIPLLSIAVDILKKYTDLELLKENEYALPVISNQKLNVALKEIAHICGIKKVLTFHAARHTFATTVTLLNGVPIESVSKMLGHTSIKTTQLYARVVDQKVQDDMNLLAGKLDSKMAMRV